jgi:shikimate dehydrogenase
MATEIYGVIGNPLGHTLSPVMHNAAYRAMGLNALYLSFETENLEEALGLIRKRNIRGVSVTLPFKESVLQLLDEVDPDALHIGSVNTVTNEDGRLRGSNTDWTGLSLDLRGRLEIRRKTIAVLGAGGAARAVVYALQQEGGLPVVANRTAARAEAVAGQFGCGFLPLSEIGSLGAEGLINTTSVGMMPKMDESPVPARVLHCFRWVADIIYNPPVTMLLREAGSAGCRTINGIGMFVNQGAEQIRIWTGKGAPRELMRKVVLDKLQESNTKWKRI